MKPFPQDQAALPALYDTALAYGKLIEGLHVAGYTFERACANLEWLLEGDRWKLGGRFADVNVFMESLRLGRFRQVAEERKRIVVRIKELQPAVSNRQIARTLGVSDMTVGRATNVADPPKNDNGNNGTSSANATNVAPAEFTGEDAAKLVLRRGIVTGVAARPFAERGLDFYETPEPATRALLDVETFDGTIWECANGRGAISRVLRAAGYRVVATDVEDYGCADAQSGVNFLQQSAAPDGVTTILTNPPYMHADDFVRQALTLVPRVVLLLRLAFVESAGRSDILDGGQLARVHVFRNRLLILPREESSALAMAWFVWDRDHHGPAELRRISWEPGDEAPALVEAREAAE
jgi:hypothetical protein